MSTATPAKNRSVDTALRSSSFAGTAFLVGLYLRRDRAILPVWALEIALLPVFYAYSLRGLYPTEQARARFASSTAGIASELALEGPIFGSSIGALTTWRAGFLYPIIALAVILTVIRHTRAEEESGRTELLDSTCVGRNAGLSAALLLAFGGTTLSGIACATGLMLFGLPAVGAIAFGVSVISAGAVFAAVAALAAQLSTGARLARGLALGVLGVAFGCRAVGDAGSGTLSWFSPLGWSQQLRPFADERWWVLLLPLFATAGLTAAAYALLRRRDVGAGLVAERSGRAVAAPTLAGPFGLAWRSQRGPLIAWTAGFGLFGLVIGSAAHGIGTQLGSSPAVTDVLVRGGGSRSLEESFIAVSLSIFGLVAAAYAVSAALQLHTEEEAERAESVLTGAISRLRWAASHILFALAGPAVAMIAAGLAAGVAYGGAGGDIAGGLPKIMAGALVQLPAIWVFAGVTIILFGGLPRFAATAWGVLGAVLALYLLGVSVQLPQPVLDLDPFAHLPKLPGGIFQIAPVLWLVLISALLLAAGLAAFRRRDLR